MNSSAAISLVPTFSKIEEAEILEPGSHQIVGYQCSVVDSSRWPLGTGTAISREIARSKALSEAIERSLVRRLNNSSQRDVFLLNEYPSTCGFAVGVNKPAVLQSSLGEAVERWLRSKWIDDGYEVPQVPFPRPNSRLESVLADQFSEVIYFKASLLLDIGHQVFIPLESGIVVGLKGDGAFVGSGVSFGAGNVWLQALIEAQRHLRIFENRNLLSKHTADLNAVIYFGMNGTEALRQIGKANRASLPRPKLRICREVDGLPSGLFCIRSLCHDFIGWHNDDPSRFVY